MGRWMEDACYVVVDHESSCRTGSSGNLFHLLQNIGSQDFFPSKAMLIQK